jgi:hypothetical protein
MGEERIYLDLYCVLRVIPHVQGDSFPLMELFSVVLLY